MTDIDVPSGDAAGLTYFVQYDEDLWNALDDERRDFCKSEWVRKATPLDGVRFVVLRLIPDALFPSGEHETPYVAWQHEITEKDDDPDYEISVVISVVLAVEWTPQLQSTIMRSLAKQFPSGAKFAICTRKGYVLSRGVL